MFVLKMPLQVVRPHRLLLRALGHGAFETALAVMSAGGPQVAPIVGKGILQTSLEDLGA